MAFYFGPITKEATEIFNFCTKYLVRDNASDTAVNEGWRFPLIAPICHDNSTTALFNEVTFIYHNTKAEKIDSVEIIGSFIPVFRSMPLQEIQFEGEGTGIYYLTVVLPVGKGYHYRFLVNGEQQLDTINPQRYTQPTGKEWSFFFTDFYNYSNEFEEWEINLLYRLVEQILPFRTEEAQNFIDRFYDNQPRHEKEQTPIYRLDKSVGEVNYITNILAREERHHLNDYKICLLLIDEVLRKRNPVVNSWEVSVEMINDLYNEMAADNVPGWDYNRYGSPQYFLKVLRRHCIVGAFCHPRHGGNIGCAGWNYLKEKYSIKDATGQVTGTCFNWQLAIEPPFGVNTNYKG
jgi:hypothetical protein